MQLDENIHYPKTPQPPIQTKKNDVQNVHKFHVVTSWLLSLSQYKRIKIKDRIDHKKEVKILIKQFYVKPLTFLEISFNYLQNCRCYFL